MGVLPQGDAVKCFEWRRSEGNVRPGREERRREEERRRTTVGFETARASRRRRDVST